MSTRQTRCLRAETASPLLLCFGSENVVRPCRSLPGRSAALREVVSSVELAAAVQRARVELVARPRSKASQRGSLGEERESIANQLQVQGEGREIAGRSAASFAPQLAPADHAALTEDLSGSFDGRRAKLFPRFRLVVREAVGV